MNPRLSFRSLALCRALAASPSCLTAMLLHRIHRRTWLLIATLSTELACSPRLFMPSPVSTGFSIQLDDMYVAIIYSDYSFRSTQSARRALGLMRRFVARVRAWPLAWPSPSGPLGWQRLQGQRRAAGASRAAGCEAPLRLEGPARTMRGVPVRWL